MNMMRENQHVGWKGRPTQRIARKRNQSPLVDLIENDIEKFQRQVEEPHVAQAIGNFLRALILGLGSMVVSCRIDDENKIRVTLPCAVIGNVATRSRLPVEWLLQKKFELWVEDDTKLCLSGITVVPIEGALDAFRILRPRFVKAGAKTVDEKSAVAWEWWDSDGGREAFRNTKMWRIIESLTGLGYGNIVPTYTKASMVLGCSLGIRQDLTSLHYRFHAKERAVDVVGTLKTLDSDSSSPDFDGSEKEKEAIGRTMFTEYAKSATRRVVANRFGRSSWNYGALFCELENELAASPASVEKMFSVARNYGGAKKHDVLQGRASSWQQHDETYQMTGKDGRVVWRPMSECLPKRSKH